VVILLASLLIVSGCGRKKRPVARVPVTVGPPAVIGATQTGVASWYGHPYHGRRAANGEIYDMEKTTAAHRTLPFETWVKVENLNNNKAVDVRITDRGPFVEGRIIDLSKAAARTIDMLGAGTAPVRLEVVHPPEHNSSAGHFAVQVGAFRNKDNAEALRRKMQDRYGRAELRRWGDPPAWRVLVGKAKSMEEARALAETIRPENGSAFVVRVDSR